MTRCPLLPISHAASTFSSTLPGSQPLSSHHCSRSFTSPFHLLVLNKACLCEKICWFQSFSSRLWTSWARMTSTRLSGTSPWRSWPTANRFPSPAWKTFPGRKL